MSMSPTGLDAVRYEAIFAACYERVLRYAQRRTDEQTAQDVAADVLLLAWRRLTELPDEPLPWLLAAARRVLSNQRRSQDRQERLQLRLTREREPVTSQRTEDAYDVADQWAAALRSLSPLDQEVLALLAWDELTHREAAAVLGCRPSTFAMRASRARRRLLTALNSETATHLSPLSETSMSTTTRDH